MTHLFRTIVLLAVISTSSTLFADWPCGFWGYSPYLGSVDLNEIPYFAMNPPVYYSHVVARPYGWSPFPHPFGSASFAYERVSQPQVVVNQYVSPSAASQATAAQPPLPLRIVNPFVK
jgi:hypothetical protein